MSVSNFAESSVVQLRRTLSALGTLLSFTLNNFENQAPDGKRRRFIDQVLTTVPTGDEVRASSLKRKWDRMPNDWFDAS